MLSKKAKYAINALVFIAKHEDHKPISVSRISEEQRIPLKFLESILTELKNARILNSTRGKFGGYSLNGKPDEINMAKVMRLFDGAIAPGLRYGHRFYRSQPAFVCLRYQRYTYLTGAAQRRSIYCPERKQDWR
ncbi:MAG: Rrf2 family transcriptional regulator [Cyclobacteriaceae bacterium]